jgi:hypothetical protein
MIVDVDNVWSILTDVIIFLFIGIVLKETRKAYTDDEERNVTASQKFSKFHYWNLDKKPSQDDKFQQTLDWMEIAKVVSQYIFFPAHMAKVNFWFHWTSVIFNDNTYFFIFLIYTKLLNEKKEGGFMVFNATFNNILVIL